MGTQGYIGLAIMVFGGVFAGAGFTYVIMQTRINMLKRHWLGMIQLAKSHESSARIWKAYAIGLGGKIRNGANLTSTPLTNKTNETWRI